MVALTNEQLARQISATEMLALFTFVNESYGGRDFTVLKVTRVNGKATVDIQLKGSGRRTVNL